MINDTNVKRLCYSVSEAVEMLGLSKPTIYRHIKNGKLPYRRIGNRILIDLETIECFGKVEASV